MSILPPRQLMLPHQLEREIEPRQEAPYSPRPEVELAPNLTPCPAHPNPAVSPHTTRILPLQSDIPPAARIWVDVPGSMTAAIGKFLGQAPEVEPVREGPSRGALWESLLLDSGRRTLYAREVVLSVKARPVLLARTLTLLDDPAVRVLRQLQRQPLAEVLFRDRRWQRVFPPFALEMRDRARRVPGRVSLWWNRATPHSRLLVEEFFLPPLLTRQRRADAFRAQPTHSACR